MGSSVLVARPHAGDVGVISAVGIRLEPLVIHRRFHSYALREKTRAFTPDSVAAHICACGVNSYDRAGVLVALGALW
jgi:hypothetical protein